MVYVYDGGSDKLFGFWEFVKKVYDMLIVFFFFRFLNILMLGINGFVGGFSDVLFIEGISGVKE